MKNTYESEIVQRKKKDGGKQRVRSWEKYGKWKE